MGTSYSEQTTDATEPEPAIDVNVNDPAPTIDTNLNDPDPPKDANNNQSKAVTIKQCDATEFDDQKQLEEIHITSASLTKENVNKKQILSVGPLVSEISKSSKAQNICVEQKIEEKEKEKVTEPSNIDITNNCKPVPAIKLPVTSPTVSISPLTVKEIRNQATRSSNTNNSGNNKFEEQLINIIEEEFQLFYLRSPTVKETASILIKVAQTMKEYHVFDTKHSDNSKTILVENVWNRHQDYSKKGLTKKQTKYQLLFVDVANEGNPVELVDRAKDVVFEYLDLKN